MSFHQVLLENHFIHPLELFAEELNFGEVEFPIYFNFFIKKAFVNPDNRMLEVTF